MFRLRNLLILLGFALLTTFMSQPTHFFHETIREGEVSDKNIFSPKNHRYVDEAATAKLQEDKLLEIEDVYVKNEQVFQNLNKKLHEFIDAVIVAKNEIRTKRLEFESAASSPSFDFSAYQAKKKNALPNPFGFSDQELEALLQLDDADLLKMEEVLSLELEQSFNSRITEQTVAEARTQFVNNSNFYYFFNKELTHIVLKRVSLKIVPNFTLDVKETKKRQQEALSQVDDAYTVVKKGELIVSSGGVVTREQIVKMQELGLLKQDFRVWDLLKQFPFVSLVLALFYFYGHTFYAKELSSVKVFVFLLSFIAFVVLMTTLIKETIFTPIPLLTALMVFMVFWGRKFTIFGSVILGLLLGFGDFSTLALALMAGMVLTLSFKRKGKRINLIMSGAAAGGVLAVADAVVYFSMEQQFQPASHFAFLISAFSAAILTVGLIPLIENALGFVTSVRLYELSDSNHPLLKRLMENALGTYTHSLMVGNLAEMAAEAVHANSLLLRVGAYFHDVGKLYDPAYFIENSTPEDNPHLTLNNPKKSAAIIRAHPLDSISLCQEYNIPEPVIQLIASHHSDSVIEYFYQKACESGEPFDLADFRYQTPTPKSKEEGILLLADSTEAFSRTLKDKPKDVVEREIRQLIFKKVEQGDLRDCALTLKDLDAIVRVFSNYLVNANHKRISYRSS